MDRASLRAWLADDSPATAAELAAEADRVRRDVVGDAVHLRGLIEISNHCVRGCTYCGLRAAARGVERYRMADDEIVERARLAEQLGFGTVVLQAGDDPGLTREGVARVVEHIKRATSLAVTLSLGERDRETWRAWRDAGADRYLLRFETSDESLYDTIRPLAHRDARHRLEMLPELRELGYEIGGGVMVGLPGQTLDVLARDVELFRELDLDMIGIGPFVPHAGTPLGERALASGHDAEAALELALRAVALARVVCPEANIPATTAVASTGGADARRRALAGGANVIMPNLTPSRFHESYEIYPGKVALAPHTNEGKAALATLLASLGRRPGVGAGSRRSGDHARG
jgi:biotin synthase